MTLLRRLLEFLQRWLAKRASVRATSEVPALTAPATAPARLVTSAPSEPPRTAALPDSSAPLHRASLRGAPHGNATQIFKLAEIPVGVAGLIRALGDPGVGRDSVDPEWERANMVVARDLPRGRWSKTGRLYCHRLVEDRIREALERCEELGVLDYITRFGCFNFRRIRHDTLAKAAAEKRPLRPLSRHSWGAAVDVNAEDNAGWEVRSPPVPWSPAWRAKFPRGVPEALVRAFESVGWTWGGRWRNYNDSMHFQLGR